MVEILCHAKGLQIACVEVIGRVTLDPVNDPDSTHVGYQRVSSSDATPTDTVVSIQLRVQHRRIYRIKKGN